MEVVHRKSRNHGRVRSEPMNLFDHCLYVRQILKVIVLRHTIAANDPLEFLMCFLLRIGERDYGKNERVEEGGSRV